MFKRKYIDDEDEKKILAEKLEELETKTRDIVQNFQLYSADNNNINNEKKRLKRKTDTFAESPDFIINRVLRDYQITGLNWLIQLYNSNLSGILADEMGLGKTIQTISLLGYIKNVKKSKEFSIIVVPKTTLGNWENEINKFCPSLRVEVLIGQITERKEKLKYLRKSNRWDILLTSYEMVKLEKYFIKRIKWEYFILDEAQRIKNSDSVLFKIASDCSSKHRILLTGTPIQNNLKELWALLNFILPNIFSNSGDFIQWFNEDECKVVNGSVANRLRRIIEPFYLRRFKSDVEKSIKPFNEIVVFCGLSNLQKDMYKKILNKDLELKNDFGELTYTRLLSIFMQLRKCVNHPYLFPNVEPEPYDVSNVVKSCGKLNMLDKLLFNLKKLNKRVLIISQFVHVLDIIDDYCVWKKYKTCRIDGNVKERDKEIEEFNRLNSDKFIFLLSNHAGGVGINIATADTVILYDSDWNPQNDLQAISRCHRIGQTKVVNVIRFIVKDTTDEKILKCASEKLKLENSILVTDSKQSRTSLNSEELRRFFSEVDIDNIKSSNVTNKEINDIFKQFHY